MLDTKVVEAQHDMSCDRKGGSDTCHHNG
jgi:hypothetical protein